MPYCPCRKKTVSKRMCLNHLLGNGHQLLKIHQQSVNLTSCLFGNLRKKKHRSDDIDSGEDSNPPQKAGRYDSPSGAQADAPPTPPSVEPGSAPDMDLNLEAEPPPVLPTTRPRIVTVDSDDSVGSSDAKGGADGLIFEGEDEDLDPELDQDALERTALTVGELLKGELASEAYGHFVRGRMLWAEADQRMSFNSIFHCANGSLNSLNFAMRNSHTFGVKLWPFKRLLKVHEL
ncbi:hypothetical protein DFH08DRAFT_808164 [Mycena albidolilacea]|uniref:Uncharacterized protein n=1 Tax=Mycena albidolilacea TaxID=1033008 RepID=A0AAD7A2T7_9AGAR|nr:hypothetical protein DFH08DRAFT_808164 [Mycena albidolilacea]